MRFLSRSLTGLFLLSLTIGLLAYSGKTIFDAVQDRMAQEDRRPQPRERIQAVNTHLIVLEDVSPILTSFGEIRSRRTLDLRASASGTLVDLADGFEEGGRVTQGQLLARIDPADAEANLSMRETDLAEAAAALAEAERALLIAADDLASAEDQARLREAALTRAIDLKDRGVGTAAAVENAELAFASSKQAILSRRQALANSESQRDRAVTTLSRQKINLNEAQRALEATEVYADFSGTLSGVNVVEGGLVTNNERLAQIVDTDALEVSFRLSTPQYVRLLDENGRLSAPPIRVSINVLGIDLKATGRITRESAAVGEGQTGRLLFAQLENASGFRPGDFVSVEILEPEIKDVALVPAAAVGNDNAVLVIDDEDKLSLLPVTILRRQAEHVLLAGDTLAGLEIVAARTPLLGAGIRVRPIETDTPSQNASTTRQAEPSPSARGEGEETIVLSEERRAKLIAFVEGNNRMPKDAKARMLTQLQQEEVPANIVRRLESRLGG